MEDWNNGIMGQTKRTIHNDINHNKRCHSCKSSFPEADGKNGFRVKPGMTHYTRLIVTSKNVIPAKAGIQNHLISPDSRWSLPRT